jgi:excisionase family DNA binding protein
LAVLVAGAGCGGDAYDQRRRDFGGDDRASDGCRAAGDRDRGLRGRELTTQQAADLLNISRPSLIQLLDDGKIANRRLGTHRRIPLGDVLAFKAENYAKRKTALDDLVAHDQALGLE